jgi:hypothetical protein
MVELLEDTNMTETDLFKCSQCGASYNSERELGEHQQAAHHAANPERKPNETPEKESGKPEDVNQQVKALAKNA